jgi:hypothetical protein
MLPLKLTVAAALIATPHFFAMAAAGPQQYKTEAEAKSQCGTDQVAWGNTSSHVLHDPGTQYYGKTTQGAYMCKAKALSAGYHEPRAAASTISAQSTPVQSKMKVHHVVIQIDQDEPAVMNLALNNAQDMKKLYQERGEKVEIEFVAFGGG